MKILVTGGLGFIGSNFIDLMLANGHEVINLDVITYAANNYKPNHKNYNFIQDDICKTFISTKNLDVIVNFAAETHVDNSIKDPNVFMKTNILGTHNLLNLILNENKNCRFIQISTDEVYGSTVKGSFSEKDILNPSSPYSSSKASSDLIALSYHKTYGLDVLVTRCTNNYGPRQHDEKLIPTIIRKLKSNQKIPIYGDGSNIRDWIYVGDHCKAIKMVIERGVSGEIYNIGSSNELNNLQITDVICKQFGLDLQDNIEFVKDRLGHDFRYSIDSTKIRNLGWSPSINFENGITKTLTWYKGK